MGDLTDLRILTIRPPWSGPVDDGVKNVENRTGTQFLNYRGLLAIHTGMGWSTRGAADPRVIRWATERGGFIVHDDLLRDLGFHHGLIRTVVTVTDAHRADGCCKPWGEDEYTEAAGQVRTDIVHMVLTRPMRLPIPVDWIGKLGLAKPGPDVYKRIMDQYEMVR